MVTRNSDKRVILKLSLLAFGLIMLLPFVGISNVSIGDLLSNEPTVLGKTIFWELRLPRVLLAFLTGAGLSLTGLIFQAFFRNPLASPFTLGVSSAAALGAAVYFKFAAYLSIASQIGASSMAFLFSAGSLVVIYFLSRKYRGLAGNGLLLAGVALSFFCSSLVVFLQYIANVAEIFSITRWLMGSVEAVGYSKVLLITPCFLLGFWTALRYGSDLDLITIGDEFALTRGVNVRVTRLVLLAVASLMVGMIVSLCGVIGFVGIMVPHMARGLTSLNHGRLASVCVLLGGSLVMVCDSIARTVVAPSEIPVGVITSLIGGPFFIVLIMSGAERLGENND